MKGDNSDCFRIDIHKCIFGGGNCGASGVGGVPVVVVGYWWWCWGNGGGSVGDSLCMCGSCFRCMSDISKCMMCGDDVGSVGGGGCGRGDGQDKSHQNHYKHHHNYHHPKYHH